MKALAVEFPVRVLCRILEVSPSGYYAWLGRKPSCRQLQDGQLLSLVTTVHHQSRQTYGSPRITRELKEQNHRCGRHRIARLMRQAGLRGLRRSRFRPRTTDSHHDLPVAPNHLKGMAPPSQPNRVWVSDITYVPTLQGWLYLAIVMDLYSRRIVGWATANHLKTSLVKEALSRALTSRRPAPGLLHHSDRGVQYASAEYRTLLKSWHIIPSMSAQGHCYDNAVAESFFSTVKIELLDRQQWAAGEKVNPALFDYIECFYNRKRRHSSLNYQSPAQFEKQLHLTPKRPSQDTTPGDKTACNANGRDDSPVDRTKNASPVAIHLNFPSNPR